MTTVELDDVGESCPSRSPTTPQHFSTNFSPLLLPTPKFTTVSKCHGHRLLTHVLTMLWRWEFVSCPGRG